MTTTPDAFRAAVIAHLFLVRMVSVCGTCGGHGVVRDLPAERHTHAGTVRGGPVQEKPCPTCAEVRDWLAAWDGGA